MAILDDLLAQTQTAAVAQATSTTLGKTRDAEGNVVLGPDTAQMLDYLNQFRMELDTANDTISQQSNLLTQQAGLIQQLTDLVNGKVSANSFADLRQKVTTLASTVDTKADAAYVTQQFQTNYELDLSQSDAIRQAQLLLATDGGLLQSLLAGQTTLGNLITGLRTDVDLKAAASTVSTLTGQVTTLRNTVGDTATGLGATYALAANALPLAGGTMTGAINVLVPTTASNPLQYSSLPLSMTVQQALPLIALGGTYSFTVPVANAVVGQVVVLNMQATLLASLSYYAAAVSAAGTVTVTLKAGLQIAAGTQTFYLRVLR